MITIIDHINRHQIRHLFSLGVTPVKRQRNVTLGSSQLSESRILRRRERDRVKQEVAESSVLSLFQVTLDTFLLLMEDRDLQSVSPI